MRAPQASGSSPVERLSPACAREPDRRLHRNELHARQVHLEPAHRRRLIKVQRRQSLDLVAHASRGFDRAALNVLLLEHPGVLEHHGLVHVKDPSIRGAVEGDRMDGGHLRSAASDCSCIHGGNPRDQYTESQKYAFIVHSAAQLLIFAPHCTYVSPLIETAGTASKLSGSGNSRCRVTPFSSRNSACVKARSTAA